jgi:hypothetical protein
MPWVRRSAIREPGGPHQTPQTAIHTPKATQFSLSTFKVGKDPSSRPKIANDTHLFSQPTSSVPWWRRSAIWDPGGPHQTPQTAIHTPKATQFTIATFNVGKDLSSCPKSPMTPIFFLNPLHPCHGGIDWPSGTPGAPIRPPKPPYIPPKRPDFPYPLSRR